MVRLVASLLAAALVLSGCSPASEPAGAAGQAQPDPRPNIIFILVDDQRHDSLGVLDPTLETPNMDRLAHEGVRFENAFVTTSLCSPSRATFLTGRYMRDHGVVDNNSDLSEAFETFPMALQQAGYQTAMIGKWHMGGDNASPRPGFDRWVSFPGQGNYTPASLFGQRSVLNVDGETVPQQGYITDELTRYALDWLASTDPERPFMLYLAHKAVHAPFRPAPRHADQYAGLDIPDPTPALAEMMNEPMWVQNQRNSWHGADFPYHSTLSLTDFMREYRRTLSAVDDSLGDLMSWLEETGRADNTIIVYTSDNGFLFGEHGLIDKRNAYEESMRIPMLAWGPDLVPGGRVVGELVSSLDIAPTFRALAGASPLADAQGLDMTPLLTGSAPDNWRDHVIYEYFWEFNYPHTPSLFAIRTERYKLIRHHGVWDTDALYDLEADPGERVNLIADPSLLEVRVELGDRLHAALASAEGNHAIPYTRRFNQGAVFRTPSGAPPAVFPQRWYRENDADDRIEHFVPDGPGKDAAVERITEILRRGEGG